MSDSKVSDLFKKIGISEKNIKNNVLLSPQKQKKSQKLNNQVQNKQINLSPMKRKTKKYESLKIEVLVPNSFPPKPQIQTKTFDQKGKFSFSIGNSQNNHEKYENGLNFIGNKQDYSTFNTYSSSSYTNNNGTNQNNNKTKLVSFQSSPKKMIKQVKTPSQTQTLSQKSDFSLKDLNFKMKLDQIEKGVYSKKEKNDEKNEVLNAKRESLLDLIWENKLKIKSNQRINHGFSASSNDFYSVNKIRPSMLNNNSLNIGVNESGTSTKREIGLLSERLNKLFKN